MTTQKTTNATDIAAQRLLNLVFIFNTTERPLSTDEIVSDSDLGYGSAVRASDIRKFRRDRASLAERGFFISEVHPTGMPENEESYWKLDRTRTFADIGTITLDDAQALVAAIDEYLAGTTTPLLTPLTSVRRKVLEVTRADESYPTYTYVDSQPRDVSQTVLDMVWTAFSLRRALPFSYTNASGITSKRVVSIYGIFAQEGIAYITGLDRASGDVRTFRVDRMERLGRPREPYEIPEGFSINEYRFMSFDFSADEAVKASFTFPAERTREEMDTITRGRGTMERTEGGAWLWHVSVRDVDAAASFALEHARDGMRAVAPAALVSRWSETIAKAVDVYGTR